MDFLRWWEGEGILGVNGDGAGSQSFPAPAFASTSALTVSTGCA